MFTGIIDNKGVIVGLRKGESELELDLEFERSYIDLKVGDSVACDGMCVTVTHLLSKGFSFYLSCESLDKTISNGYKIGSMVNLERPVCIGGRLDGHYVSGHIDGVTSLDNIKKMGESFKLTFLIPIDNKRYFVPKGAITINGISLTVNDVSNKYFDVNIIPHTYKSTNISNLTEEAKVNYEVDILAKYFVSKNLGDQNE